MLYLVYQIKEKSIIISRIIYEKKYKDIAKEFKVSYQYIQYLYNNAIGKLKTNNKKRYLGIGLV